MSDENCELVDYLKRRGHSQGEVDQILANLQQRENDVLRQSIFDSIAAGNFDLEEIIKQALGDAPE